VSQMRRALVLSATLAACAATAAHAQGMRAIWGLSPTNIWAVGDGGAALHFDGQAWTRVAFGLPVTNTFFTVWGSGPNDVFVGGDALILHWNGQAWSEMRLPTERAIVGLAGRSATQVYALAQSYSDREAPTLLTWNGRAWTAAPLPMPFRANALALSGASVLVAGFAMNDPTPNQRRTYGVLARRLGPRWTMAGWNGRLVTDRVVAGAGWSSVSASGTAILLLGEDDEGSRMVALSRRAAFTLLPRITERVVSAFLGSDGVPVAVLEGGLARFSAGAWAMAGPSSPSGPNAQMVQAIAQNPMAYAAQTAAWGDLASTLAAWGSSTDFYAVTETGRIIRVQAATAQIVYDPSCVANPQMAAMNPVCQALQQTGAAVPQAPRPALPMPSIRVKRP